MSNQEVRVRFAPSPTGSLHIGGVRTALYNYLFARQHGGKFIIRIEDTDQTRYVPGAEEYIYESLNWLGIHADEGVVQGGPHAPYRQSERKHIYKQYALQLVESGHAYYAFDTAEELEQMRERLKAAKVVSPQYNAITRMNMKNSLTLPEDEVKRRLESGEPYVIRLKVPRKEEIRLHDLIRGWVMVHSNTLDDKVLMKSDGMPTYHLANVVDDHLMQITHVIRGEEWLPSAPTHVLLYQYLGWESTMPKFAHLPLLLKPDGNGKLSKRDGEMMGFPVFPLQWTEQETGKTIKGFREEGYLPEALVNFLAFLGWNPGTPQEIFSMDELIKAFSIERIGKSGTKFDINKAKWYNHQYLLKKSTAELVEYLKADLQQHGYQLDVPTMEKMVELVKERITFPADLYKEAEVLLRSPEHYDEQVVANKWNEDAVAATQAVVKLLEASTVIKADEFKSSLHHTLESMGIKPGKVMQAIRVALTGRAAGPDLMQIFEIIGRDEAIQRLNKALNTLTVKAS